MKKICAVAMSAVLLLGALSFAGCDGNADEMKSLQEQINTQTELLQMLEGKLTEQTEQLEKLKEEIADGQTENANLLEKLNTLGEVRDTLLNELAELEVRTGKNKGTICTLQEAYDQGKLTRNDLMHISYYCTGEVYEHELGESAPKGPIYDTEAQKKHKVEFTPSKELTELDRYIEKDIKVAFAISEKVSDFKGLPLLKFFLITDYSGEFSGNYIFRISGYGDGFADVYFEYYVGGVCFSGSGGWMLSVFSYEE